MQPKIPRRPPLTNFNQPVENVTLYSNIQRWLMNTSQNLPQVYGPDAYEILSRLEDEETTNRLLTEEVRQLSDLAERRDPEKRTVYILAAGASLTQYRTSLAKLKETGYLIASPTVVPWMVKQAHVSPDLVVVMDGNPESVVQIRGSGIDDDSDAALLMSPEAPPQLPTLFGRYRTYWIRTAIPGPDGSMDWEPYSIFQSFLGRAIKYRLAQLGCVTNMMVSAALALQTHARWTFDRIVLVGADYGYWRGFSRIPKDGSATLSKYDKSVASNFKHGKVVTDRRMVRYKASLMILWLQTKAPIYSMSHGILGEFPRVTEKQLLEGHFPEYPQWEELHTRIMNWMNWFRTESGLVEGVEKSMVKERAYQVTFTDDAGEALWGVVTATDAEDAIKRARGVTRASDEATVTYRDLGPTKNLSLTKELEERVK